MRWTSPARSALPCTVQPQDQASLMSACGETSQHLPLKSHLPSVHSNLKKNRFYFSSHDHEHVAHTGGALPARPTADTCALPVAHPTQSHGPLPRRQVGPARPRTTWAAALPAPTVPGPTRNLHPTTPRPSLPGPTCRPGPRQRHRAMPPGHLPPWPRCHPRRGTRASAPPFKTRQRRGGGESLVATTL